MRSTLYCLICCLCLSGVVLAQSEVALNNTSLNVDKPQNVFAVPLPLVTTDSSLSVSNPEVNQDKADTPTLENRLVELENNYAAIKSRVGQLEQKLVKIAETEENNSVLKQSNSFHGKIQQYIGSTRDYLGPQTFTLIIAGIIILLLILLFYLIISSATRIKTKTSSPMATSYPAVSAGADDNEEEEMDSESKLNLARAYIDMEDYSKALTLLYEVIAQGNSIEQEEAKELI